MSEKQESTLAHIHEMFKDKIDEDVIKLVLTECQNDVEKTVTQLLNMCENNGRKANNGSLSSTRRIDSIDPVDTPLPDMERYLNSDIKSCNTHQLDFSTFPPSTKFTDFSSTTKPSTLGNNLTLGTAQSVSPNYPDTGNKKLSESKKNSVIEPKVKTDSNLSDGFNDNETYISDDDDTDEHIDSMDGIDSIDSINKSDKVNQNGANRGSSKDAHVVGQNLSSKMDASQSFLDNKAGTKASNQQSPANGQSFKPKKPQQKQESRAFGSRTISPHPFAPQILPNNQSSYFANQARYFSTLVPGTFSHPFIPSHGMLLPGQYHRLPQQPGFMPRAPRHPVGPAHSLPTASMIRGDKAPSYPSPQTMSMTCDNARGTQSLRMNVAADGVRGPMHSTAFIPGGINRPNRRPNPPNDTTPIAAGNKASNHAVAANTVKRDNKPPNLLVPNTFTHGNKGSNYLKTNTTAHDNKEPGRPITNTTTNINKGPNHAIPNTSHGNKGSNHTVLNTTTHNNKGLNHTIPDTTTHGNKGPNHPTPNSATYRNNGPANSTSITNSMKNGTNRADTEQNATVTHYNKEPNHPAPNGTTRNSKGSVTSACEATSAAQATTTPHGSKGSNHTSLKRHHKGSSNMQTDYDISQTKTQAIFPSEKKKSLTILRGLPGSGKSTLARQLNASNGGLVISTDDFFATKNRKYCFNPMELTEAHQWNQNRAKTFMEAGLTPLIIDNTNIQSWEMRPYVLTGLKCGYEVDIKEPETSWKWNIKELERKNTHGVPLKVIERMLERWEKNVTVEAIAKSASTPIAATKSNGGEDSNNAAKQKTATEHKHTSNENRLKNKTKKTPQADIKLGHGKVPYKPCPVETRQPGTTKKGISLSANFSAPNSSKRSFEDSTSEKKERKEHGKDAKNDALGKGLDGTGNAMDVSKNNELNFNVAVVPVSSADAAPIDELETLEKQSVPQVKMRTLNKLNTSIRSDCGDETSSGESKSAQYESSEIDTSIPSKVSDNKTLLQEVSGEDDGSKREFSMNIEPNHQESPTFDKEFISINTSDNVSGFVKKSCNEEIRNESEIDDAFPSQQTFLDSEHKNTFLQPDFQTLRQDGVADVYSDCRQCNSEGVLYESSSNKTNDTNPVVTDKGSVASLETMQNRSELVKNNQNSCPNDQKYSPQNETLDVKDSACAEDSCFDIQVSVADTNHEETSACFDVGVYSDDLGLATNSSSQSIGLQALKDENALVGTVKRNPSTDVLIDSNISQSFLQKAHCDPTSRFNDDRCGDNTVLPDTAQHNAVSGACNVPIESIKDPVSGSQKHNLSDAIDLVENRNSNVHSETKFDVSNTDAVGVCKGSGRDLGCDNQASEGTNINSNIVQRDPSSTLSNPCTNGSNGAADLCTVSQWSNDHSEGDYKNAGKTHPEDDTNSDQAEKNSVNAQLHSNVFQKPLTDGTKTNVNDRIFDLQTCDPCTTSDQPGSPVDKYDSSGSIQFLKDCFPLTEIDILKSFLNSCSGDLIKTVDSLLEHNKKDYQPVSSFDDDMYQESVRSSVPATEIGSQSFFTSPNHNREQDVASRYQKTPEDNRSSCGSPMSASSTPTKIKKLSVDSLQLTLDPALALQLLEMFGAFSGVSAKDPLSESARSIRIDKDFAKILYTKWRKSIQAKNKAKKTEESKKISPGISEGNAKRKYKTPPRQFYLPHPIKVEPPKSVAFQPEPVSLKEIMDEQFAIHVSQSDQAIEKTIFEEQLDLSTKLKRSRLHGMFPSVDPVALNEIFQANNYDFDTTILQVQSSCGMPPIGKSSAVTEQSSTLQQSPGYGQSDFQSDSSTDLTDVDGNFQSMHDPSYHDYRAEAQTHFELRAECIKKAALAYNKRQGELAKIYADQARQHGEKIKEANRRAAEKILESRNHDLLHSNTLDLHELHVKEAIQALENVLEERRNERRNPHKKSPSYLEVITGRGNRSRNGIPRIKYAVVDYLKRHGYRYEELNSGLYKVFLH